MARPRIFISSTYYDLKAVRADIEHFVREQGYDPVLNERGHVAYSKENAPSQDCYREIQNCDILVAIIGGKFGSASHEGPYSISQQELRTAINDNKQVYIFVDRDVMTEFRTYLPNKDKNIEWVAAQNQKIYEFLEEVLALPNNNPVMPFETSQDIINLLREQWAGLFQRLIQQSTLENSFAIARELRQGIETAERLAQLLQSKTSVEEVAHETVKAVLLPNHAAFKRLQRILKVSYRIYFTNLDELQAWLKIRGFETIDDSAWDSKDFREWFLKADEKNWDLLKISVKLFDDDGQFNPSSIAWSPELIKREVRPREDNQDDNSDDSDDVPF